VSLLRSPKELKKDLAAGSFLRAVPCSNQAVEVQPRRNGGILVTVPIRRPKYLVPPISWLLPFSKYRRVELEAAGAEIFRLCDGKRRVEDVIEKFAIDHKLSFREAQLPVGKFLTQLTERGLLAIVGLQKDSEKA